MGISPTTDYGEGGIAGGGRSGGGDWKPPFHMFVFSSTRVFLHLWGDEGEEGEKRGRG